MTNKVNAGHDRKKLIVYVLLALTVFAVFGQARHFGFINFDDQVYVTENPFLKQGLSPGGIAWAFSTTYAEFWHPLTWLSLLFDYQLHGMNAGGYHLTNVLLHIMSVLLLFGFLCRATGDLRKSAFAAAFFAIHPLRVESVAWVAERKDVLSLFFAMLTLYLYGYYAKKPDIKKYLLVVFAFALALMSKPVVVTLPALMILLDYWPLGRFAKDDTAQTPAPALPVQAKKKKQKKGKQETGAKASPAADRKLPQGKIAGVIPVWQLWEKIPLFVLSALFSVATIYTQRAMFTAEHTMAARLANAPVSVARYLANTFWPRDLAIFYPFSDHLPAWLVVASILLIILMTAAAVAAWKRAPYLFAGWLWFVIALTPVIGLIRSTTHSMHDCYTYLPSVGLAAALAWGVPALMPRFGVYKKILSATAAVLLFVLAVVAWKQCGYWSGNDTLWPRVLRVTENNYIAHNNLGVILLDMENFAPALEYFNRAVAIKPDFADPYNNRGNVWNAWGLREAALKDYNEALRLRPKFAKAFNNRGAVYLGMGRYSLAIADLSEAVGIDPGFAVAFNNRGAAYYDAGQYGRAVDDYSEAIRLNPGWADPWVNRGIALGKLGDYGRAAEDFNEALHLNTNFVFALSKRGINYFMLGDRDSGCRDLFRACDLGDCQPLHEAKAKGTCR